MKPLHRYLASLAVAAALLTSARRGDAKEPTSAPASATALAAAAKAKAKQASVQYGLGNFSGALALYLEALKVLGHPALIFNVAQCYYALQRWQQAVFHYDHYLAEWSKHHGGQAAPNLAGVLRRIAKAKLAIKQQQMNKALSRPVIVRPTIVMKTPASNVARMQLSGIAQNGARVLIDGQLLGLTPVASAFELPPGKHRVRVEAAGCLPWQRDVMLQAGKATQIPVDLQRPRARSKGWLALTIATLALAAGAEAMAIVYWRLADEHIKGSAEHDSDRNLMITGHVLAASLAALSALPLVLYLRSGSEERARAIQAGAPAPTPLFSVAPLPGGFVAGGTVRF